MKPQKLFQAGCNFAPDYGFFGSGIEKVGNYIQEVELISLKVTGTGTDTDYEWHPKEPNCYGIYLRYTDFAIRKLNLNPSEWIADFSSREVAEQFKNLVIKLLTAHMNEEEKEQLFFKLNEEPASQVSAKKIISDGLREDLAKRWKEIRCLGYSKNHLQDGRAEQWQLFITPMTDYLMLDEGGDVQEYIYFNEADMENDIELMMDLKDTFTEI